MTAAREAEQGELFDVPAAYLPPLWRYTPNAQDACAPVDLDVELERGDQR